MKKTWKYIFVDTKETKLQELQWKIVHNIFPTNIILNRMKIKDSENCDICGEKDFIEHYFFKCERVNLFWKDVSCIISTRIDRQINLNETSVLLGIEQDKKYQDLNNAQRIYINETLMVGKLSVVKSRTMGYNIYQSFHKEINIRPKIKFLLT